MHGSVGPIRPVCVRADRQQPVDRNTDGYSMSDDRPGESTGDANSEPNILDDLDDVLAQAASLADDLSNEIGTSDDSDPADTPAPGEASGATDGSDAPTDAATDATAASENSDEGGTTSDFPPADADLDNELAELERLVGTVADEIDGDEPGDAVEAENADSAATTTNQPAAPSGSQASEKPAVPDFMSEFTDAEAPTYDQDSGDATATEPAGGDQPTATAKAVADSKQGVVSSSMLGVVGTPSTAEDPVAEGTTDAESTEELAPVKFSASMRLKAWVAGPLSTLAVRAGLVVAEFCEQIDRPFTRLKAPLRRALGYFAIATFGTAILALMLSVV